MMNSMKMIHFFQGMALQNKFQALFDGPIYPLTHVRSSKAMRKLLEKHISQILSNQIQVSIIAVNISQEIIILAKFCSDLQIPILWNGPIRHFSPPERKWLLNLDPSLISLPEYEASESFFPILLKSDDVSQNASIIEKISQDQGWGIISSTMFFKNWIYFSRSLFPLQNYLITHLSLRPFQWTLFDFIGITLLNYIRLTNLMSLDSIKDFLNFIPSMISYDSSQKEAILFGTPRNEDEFKSILSLYGISDFSVTSLPSIEYPRYGVVSGGLNGKTHSVTVSPFEIRCSCINTMCPAILIVNWHMSSSIEEWGLLTFLQRHRFIQFTERLANPRNLLETIFNIDEGPSRLELTFLGKNFIDFTVPFSLYLTTDMLLRKRLVNDDPSKIMETLSFVFGNVINELLLTKKSKKGFARMILSLSFIHGYSKLYEYAKTLSKTFSNSDFLLILN